MFRSIPAYFQLARNPLVDSQHNLLNRWSTVRYGYRCLHSQETCEELQRIADRADEVLIQTLRGIDDKMQLGSVNQGEKHLEVCKQFLSKMDDLFSVPYVVLDE